MKRRHSRADAIALCARLRAAAAGHRVRRRSHRGVPDGERGDVRELAAAGGGVRPHLPACVPLFGARGHAGGAHAAGGGHAAPGAGGAAARAPAMPARQRFCRGRRRPRASRVLVEKAATAAPRPLRAFRAGCACERGDAGAAPWSSARSHRRYRQRIDRPRLAPHERDAASEAGAQARLAGAAARRPRALVGASWPTGIAGIFTKRRLDEAALRELEELLIAGDLGPATAAKLTAGARQDPLRPGGHAGRGARPAGAGDRGDPGAGGAAAAARPRAEAAGRCWSSASTAPARPRPSASWPSASARRAAR